MSETFSPAAERNRPAEALNAACRRVTTTSSGAVVAPSEGAGAVAILTLPGRRLPFRFAMLNLCCAHFAAFGTYVEYRLLGEFLSRLGVRALDAGYGA